MTATLDDVEQLVGLPADGDATVIGGTWGFSAILVIFANILLQDLNAFKSLKDGGAGNSLSLKKLKSHYAYKLEKVLSDGTAIVAKKKKRHICCMSLGLSYFSRKREQTSGHATLSCLPRTRWQSHGYLYISQSWWDPQGDGLRCILALYLLEMDVSVTDRYGGTTLLNFREALDNYKLEDTSECDLLKEAIEQMKADIELKREVDEQCALEFVDLPSLSVELNEKCKEINSLKAFNALLMEHIDLQLSPATPLAVLQSYQPVPDTTLTKTYEDLLVVHEDIKKKLIAKEDFRQKLVNAEERMKSLEANNSEW
ncbi:hypothetical protein GIB67_031229, partial [Kingdonia uniflora]